MFVIVTTKPPDTEFGGYPATSHLVSGGQLVPFMPMIGPTDVMGILERQELRLATRPEITSSTLFQQVTMVHLRSDLVLLISAFQTALITAICDDQGIVDSMNPTQKESLKWE